VLTGIGMTPTRDERATTLSSIPKDRMTASIRKNVMHRSAFNEVDHSFAKIPTAPAIGLAHE
jgi:hypothetical protein